ncbi:SPOR domain-containing protein [Sphingomonas sp. ST-64]|uniref:SPOR domain-containing protein n=1 Tax=Sphingomonas plantiphila TaxID=3163295 RepID=A0ABW8YRJ3_9SPHN
MKSRISLVAAALLAACSGGGGDLQELPPAAAGPAPEANLPPAYPAPAAGEGAPATGDGPQGSSRLRPGEERYDRVGYAGYAGAGEGVFALSSVLPQGSHAEVTALDTGKTILILIRGPGQGLIELSGAAARQLGVTGTPPVRVRRTSVTAQDATALAAGQPVPPRADAPPALLAGLRRRLGATPREEAAAPPPERPARPARQPAQPAARPSRGLFVQVAALSSAARAKALADQLGGIVRPGGGVYRIQLGPYTSSAAAERARADVARRGFGDARIISVP